MCILSLFDIKLLIAVVTLFYCANIKLPAGKIQNK